MDRLKFLKTSLMTTGSTFIISGLSIGKSILHYQEEPKLDKTLVEKFVGAGHGKMDVVKELLEEHPTLLNAAHDWRGGDFETALGAASHVGYKDLAQFLINEGAQTNLFTAALFGKLNIIKPVLEFFPKSLHAKGPHGYTLLHHAIKGGEEAADVVEYLQSLGAKETKVPLY
jgi:ankyrin repeat protein